MFYFCLLSLLVCIWVVFFNGAERLEGTWLGYFEFGEFADKAKYIKAAAWLGLAATALGLVYSLL